MENLRIDTMIKYTKHTLKKIEELFSELEYSIIYGKGNFSSGFCLVESQKKAVINRFFETEARINSLLEILTRLKIEEDQLSEKSDAFYQSLMKQQLAAEEAENQEKEEATKEDVNDIEKQETEGTEKQEVEDVEKQEV